MGQEKGTCSKQTNTIVLCYQTKKINTSKIREIFFEIKLVKLVKGQMKNKKVSKYLYSNSYVSHLFSPLISNADYLVPDSASSGHAAVSVYICPHFLLPDHSASCGDHPCLISVHFTSCKVKDKFESSYSSSHWPFLKTPLTFFFF